jgi:ubiquinone/menaquinone biosynthesis C-methylase UbiE
MTNSIATSADLARKSEEAEFHNRRESDRLTMSEEEYNKRYSNKRFYAIVRKSVDYQNNWLMQHCKGKTVLDYCCGLGATSLNLAKMGAKVFGIDISAKEVETADKLLKDNGFTDATFLVGDAENTPFENGKFDVVVCNGVLHHLDISKAWPELARIIKKDGSVMAMEALGYNPAIQLYRRLTPKLRTAWETEHILKHKDLQLAKKYFNKVEVKYFYLAALCAIPFINTPAFKPILAVTEMVDDLLLKIPGINLMAWQMVFVLSEPKPQ